MNEHTDFQEITLSSKQKNLLKKLRKGSLVAETKEHYETLCWLAGKGLVHIVNDNEAWFGDNLKCHFEITEDGRMWLRYHRRAWWKELRAWLTLGISLAAFIKSFFF